MVSNDLKAMLKYYMVFIAMSFIPIVIVTIFIYGKVSEPVLWVITFSVMLLFILIGMLYRPKYNKKKQEKEKNNIDPFK